MNAQEGPSYLGRPPAEWAALLGDKDPIERRLAAHALGEIGPAAAPHVEALTAALKDSVSFVRVWAAGALARVDPSRPEATAALVAATQDEAGFVRSLAAWILGRLGRSHPGIDSSFEALRRLETDTDPSVRTEATLALTRLVPS